MERTNKLLIICGPTATGKTALAVKLAKKFNGELVSADSRQVYTGMDIGTGKDRAALGNVPIWMYDVVRPDEQFSVSQYSKMARAAVTDIQKRGKLPIVVGGTGLYIASITKNHSTYSVPPNNILRKELENNTLEELQCKLRSISPDFLDALNNSDKNNPRRLIRKIELAQYTGMPLVYAVNYSILAVGLSLPADELKRRIDMRVDARVDAGQLTEVKNLLSKGYTWDIPAMSGLGYIQWKEVFLNIKKPQDAIDEWKLRELQYAKRQITWFKKDQSIVWVSAIESDYGVKVEQLVSSWYTKP